MIRSVALALALLAATGIWAVAQDDPCAGQELNEDEIGLNYQGHCLPVDNDGPAVQAVIISRTEDLDGFSATGIVVVRTAVDTWVIQPTPFLVLAADDVQVGDSGYLVMGGEE